MTTTTPAADTSSTLSRLIAAVQSKAAANRGHTYKDAERLALSTAGRHKSALACEYNSEQEEYRGTLDDHCLIEWGLHDIGVTVDEIGENNENSVETLVWSLWEIEHPDRLVGHRNRELAYLEHIQGGQDEGRTWGAVLDSAAVQFPDIA